MAVVVGRYEQIYSGGRGDSMKEVVKLIAWAALPLWLAVCAVMAGY